MSTSRNPVALAALLSIAATFCTPAASETPAGESDAARSTLKKDAMSPRYSKTCYDITPFSRDAVKKLASKLAPEAYRITQSAGTERAFCGTLLDNKKEGIYVCVVCGLPLFSSEHKFTSGSGWPSFYREFDPQHVARKRDTSHGTVRTEINCARCDAHLGHVFEDGPKPTGERHCLNSASLEFHEKGAKLPPQSRPLETETAYFAGGCFWGIEHYFQKGPGVIDAVSGYMQGSLTSPTYKQVCTGDTGHAETVKVVFDPKRITYRRLLEAFFAMHDSTQLNRQRVDVGSQYRSGIWTTSGEQKREAEAFVKELATSPKFAARKIVTQIQPAKVFFPAEDYHQDYIVKTRRACHVASPW